MYEREALASMKHNNTIGQNFYEKLNSSFSPDGNGISRFRKTRLFCRSFFLIGNIVDSGTEYVYENGFSAPKNHEKTFVNSHNIK
ncbi:hypothetical protein C8C85_3101 [Flavobacterium sp. 103]|nr:hypothetical protein C8C85_3101 [Flavobacterium sp. 103]